jgi:hypothetical protein
MEARFDRSGSPEGLLQPVPHRATPVGWPPHKMPQSGGAQAARVAVGRAPQANPSVEAAVVPGETAGAAAALNPPDVLLTPVPASAEAVAVLPVEPPVAADAEMAEAPLLEVDDQKPAPLAEEVPDAA